MFWIFLGILAIVLFVYLMRQFFVKPIFEIMRNCGTSLANMAMYFAMRGGNFWQKQYYMAREELEFRENAVARIKEIENPKFSKMFMTASEEKEYYDFFGKVERCKKTVRSAERDYKKFCKET